MKKIIAKLNTLVLVALIASSCSIQKRQHFSGYHIEWKTNKKHDVALNSKSKNQIDEVSKEKLEEQATYSIDEEAIVAYAKPELILEKKAPLNFTQKKLKKEAVECDEIILKDGTIIKGKVQEIGTEEIKYKRCDNPDGPVIAIKKSSVLVIKYPNGTTDVIKQENETKKQNSNNNTSNSITKYEPMAIAAITALSLAFICGFLSLVTVFVGGVGFLFVILSFIFSLIALKHIKRKPEGEIRGKALAKISLIVSSILIGLTLLGIAILILLALA